MRSHKNAGAREALEDWPPIRVEAGVFAEPKGEVDRETLILTRQFLSKMPAPIPSGRKRTRKSSWTLVRSLAVFAARMTSANVGASLAGAQNLTSHRGGRFA